MTILREIEHSGFNYQNEWTGNCAQRSLIHSLLLLGIPISEQVAHEKTSIPKYKTLIRATSISAITKAINRCDCIPYPFKFATAKETRTKIDEYLNNDMPVIVHAEEGKHWGVLAAKESRDYYYWIDSDASDLYGCDHWTEIREWIENGDSYTIIGIRPKDDKLFNHTIIKNFDDVYDSFDDDTLAEYWGLYLDDLVNLFDSPVQGDTLTAHDFFNKHQDSIIGNLEWQNGEVDKKDIRYELNNYRIVAESHKLTISLSHEYDALIGLTAAMAYAINDYIE